MTCRVVITHWSNGISDVELWSDLDHIGVWQSHPSASPEYARDWAEEQASRLGRIIGCPVEGHRKAAPQQQEPQPRPVPAAHRIAEIAYEILETSPSVTVSQICDKAGIEIINGHDYLRLRDALDDESDLVRVHPDTGEQRWEPR